MAKFISSTASLMEIAQGTAAFASIVTIAAPQNSKISGFVMPEDVDSIINFKLVAPPSISTTANQKIRIYLISLETETSPEKVVLSLGTHATATTETVNVIFTTESDTEVDIPIAKEILQIVDIPLTNAPAVGDFITGQLKRKGTSVTDTAKKVLIVKIQLLVDVDVT